MNILILAAGLGTRLKPITDYIPKALFPVKGKPLLQHIIEKICNTYNKPRIIINTFHHAEQIINYVNTTRPTWNADIIISDERPNLLDTGGAIRKAHHLFTQDNTPVLIHNVDIISNVNILKFYENNKNKDATLLVSKRNTTRYLIFNNRMSLVGWINIKTGEVKSPYLEILNLTVNNFNFESHRSFDNKYELYAFSGIHLMSRSLCEETEAWPESFSIIDFYLANCKKYDIHGYTEPDIKISDMGKLETIK